MPDEGVLWNPQDSRADRPPLDRHLSGWEVHKRRRSHLNASREHAGRRYHLKWFFRRLRPGNPARREFLSAARVSALGIPSVVPVGWGRHPGGTFFVMEGSPGLPVFELPRLPAPPRLRSLASELGRLVARLHDAGLCHRDLYVDHVLIHGDSLRLIDVGRVARFRRRRWIEKDLGGLLFSAWREGLPSDVCRAFFRSYLRHSRRTWDRRGLIARLQRKARRYWRHNERRPHLGVAPRRPRRE